MASVSKPPVGWPLLPVPDESGRLAWPELEPSVFDSLKILLRTRPGEQLLRPTYGAGLQDFVGQPDTTTTRRRIRDTVTESIKRWEPRVQLEGVDLLDDPRQPGWLRVEIRFRIRRTGALRRLGLTLSLENS
ncbi:MAG: GPW/gp25 family protein [Alphaproteobacteria bacterium]|nr:GPW/gp25 family protein [Alphaproteobacteria bacterium]